MKKVHDEKFGTSYRPDCADEWLELIHDIAVDYDGCCTVDGLKYLIDEIVDYASKARVCLHSGDIFRKDELKPRTHFDEIKAMDVEKMAKILVIYDFDMECYFIYGGRGRRFYDEDSAISAQIDYLESEVEE